MQDFPIIGSDLSTRSPLNHFMSGLWSIVGFKHVIKNNTMESNFKLVKATINTEKLLKKEDLTTGMELPLPEES